MLAPSIWTPIIYLVALIVLGAYIHYQLRALVAQYHKKAAAKLEEEQGKPLPVIREPEEIVPTKTPKPKRATKKDDPDTVDGINTINDILVAMIVDQDLDQIDSLSEVIADLSENADAATIKKYFRKIALH